MMIIPHLIYKKVLFLDCLRWKLECSILTIFSYGERSCSFNTTNNEPKHPYNLFSHQESHSVSHSVSHSLNRTLSRSLSLSLQTTHNASHHSSTRTHPWKRFSYGVFGGTCANKDSRRKEEVI